MKRIAIYRLMLLPCCLTLVALMASSAIGQEPGSTAAAPFFRPTPNQKTSIRPVLDLTSNLAVLPAGGSILVRTPTGVFATIHGSGFTPGEAVTVWFVIFNHPEYCAATICNPSDVPTAATQASALNAGGAIIGPDGNLSFGAFRAFGDTSRAFVPGPGLIEPFSAQIHLVLRSHGKASSDPVILKSQLSEFFGGCPGGDGCTDREVSVHQPEP
jgi:hypothetical protein